MAIEDRSRVAKVLAKSKKAFFFSDPGRGIGGVAQHKPVELRAAAGFLDRFINRAQSRQHAIGILIVGRQEHCGPAMDRRQGNVGVDAEFVFLPRQQHEEAGKRRHEGEGDPGKQQHEQPEDERFQDRDAADLEYPVHLVTARRSQDRSPGQDKAAPGPHRCKVGRRRWFEPPQWLHRHIDRRFLGKEFVQRDIAGPGRSTGFR